MFESFFPRPKLFLLSAIGMTFFSVIFWYSFGTPLGQFLGFTLEADPNVPIIGVSYFISSEFLWFYLYYIINCGLFAAFWFRFMAHKWQLWSIMGSQLILFSTYFSVQVLVAINNWKRPFFDAIQNALSGNSTTTETQLYEFLLIFTQIAFVWICIFVVTRFFVSHYVFRWRQAMNDFYISKWKQLRHIEGASQRVQEDTMRFAGIVEGLGVAIIDSVMTLFAFLPILLALSSNITSLPFLGEISSPLLTAAIFWSVFGTVFLAVVGMKLPGLEFRNQRVEAAYRKELVYGEDDANRAQPPTVKELFSNIRKNYFRLYFHYMYFNVARSFYLQADNIFASFLLIPTIAAGVISFGLMQQILTAFTQVTSSFQYLVTSWPTIVELISIYKRLQAFEAAILNVPLPKMDQDFMADPHEK